MLRFRDVSTTVVAVLSLALFFVPVASAQSSFNEIGISFALTIPANSSDLVFTLKGPTSQAWIAVGTGRSMQGSMMFVAYSDANGQNVTLSPRIGPQHNEPKFSKDINVSILAGTGITNGMFVVNAHCQNCKTWNGGSLDFSSKAQDWIYAIGPSQASQPVKSDSTSATIPQHDISPNVANGNIQLDMIHATAQSSDIAAPTTNTTSSGSKVTTGSTTSTGVLIIHGVLTVLGFLLLMPAGALILRLLDSVRWHWVTQLAASIIAIVGGVIGFAVTNSYYDAKTQASPHKGIGIVVLIATGVQVLIGWWHHWVYKRKGHGTFFGVIHRYFGWVVMVAGIANAGIGLDLVVSTAGVVAYIVVAYIFLIAVAAAVMLIKWRKARAKGLPEIRHNVEGNYASNVRLESYPQAARPYDDRR